MINEVRKGWENHLLLSLVVENGLVVEEVKENEAHGW